MVTTWMGTNSPSGLVTTWMGTKSPSGMVTTWIGTFIEAFHSPQHFFKFYGQSPLELRSCYVHACKRSHNNYMRVKGPVVNVRVYCGNIENNQVCRINTQGS